MVRVDVVYFTAGSGHVSAAVAIERALHRARPDWRVRALDLVDVLAPHRLFRATSRLGIAYFNRMLTAERGNVRVVRQGEKKSPARCGGARDGPEVRR